MVCFVVGFKGILLDLFHKGTFSVLGNVAIVVTNHFDEECFGFTLAGLRENLLVDHINDELAITGKLSLNAGFVGSKSISVLRVLGVLFNCGDSTASSTLRADQVFESDGEEIALVRGDFGSFNIKDLR